MQARLNGSDVSVLAVGDLRDPGTLVIIPECDFHKLMCVRLLRNGE